MIHDHKDGTISISFDSLVRWLSIIFEKHGCSKYVAGIVADNCASAERDGLHSHGLFRMEGYASSLDCGWINGQAIAEPAVVAPGFLRVDANNGFAQVALHRALPLLLDATRLNGIAIATIRRSHHFGALALDVEKIANQGFIALSVVNSHKSVVPFGATRPVLGTNPIAFATPRGDQNPLVFDFATSTMANGEVAIAAREGRDVPPGTGVDAQGRHTTNAHEIMDGGSLLPFGGHKGSSLSLMVEILCAALAGSKFSYEVVPRYDLGAQTSDAGQTVIAIDPRRAQIEGADFLGRSEALFAELIKAGQLRLPSDRRYAVREASKSHGIFLTKYIRTSLENLSNCTLDDL